ncbi:glycosyltransferase family 2 protein [Bifidobacterium catenulatum]|nr:glycosyltransferase family 2 protein [Bifidobacterium catenulatum]MDK9934155.1 glycosyltransferase family 2 protein [Bifidobacterium catenulatum]
MTSYPARINTVHLAIRSLLAQKVLPDKIVLWLCKSDFPNREADLPQNLRDVLWYDVEVRWVDDDLKPHKKYFWSLQEFSDDYVITTDDDLLYRNTMIGDLLAAHEAHPHAIAAVRTHLIMFNEDGTRTNYEDWIYEAPHYHPALVGVPSMRIFATNGAGTLYPPHVMPLETFDAGTIKKTCLTADDLWLKVMQVKAGIPVVAATDDQLLNYVPGTQGEEALCHQNTESGVNNIVLKAILGELQAKGVLADDFDKLVADPSLDALIA